MQGLTILKSHAYGQALTSLVRAQFLESVLHVYHSRKVNAKYVSAFSLH